MAFVRPLWGRDPEEKEHRAMPRKKVDPEKTCQAYLLA